MESGPGFVTAQLRGWTPLIALQLEYSLPERTIEGELIPTAVELGLGVTPWSPLKSGMLIGKYTRANVSNAHPLRGAFVSSPFNEQAFRVRDVLTGVANELRTTPVRGALAWVQQPGATSTIIGARTIGQLEDNLGALEVKLLPQHLRVLDEVSRPKLNFPHDLVGSLGTYGTMGVFGYAGATIDGQSFPDNPLYPKSNAERH